MFWAFFSLQVDDQTLPDCGADMEKGELGKFHKKIRFG